MKTVTLRKPIPLPEWGLLFCIQRMHGIKKPKWRVTPTVKDQYRDTKEKILQYDWNYTFVLKNYGSRVTNTIKIFYGNWADHYQVCYKVSGIDAIVLMVRYEDMTDMFLKQLLCNNIRVRGHENS